MFQYGPPPPAPPFAPNGLNPMPGHQLSPVGPGPPPLPPPNILYQTQHFRGPPQLPPPPLPPPQQQSPQRLVQDANGWYQQRPKHSPPPTTPHHPTGGANTSQVDDFWKGKLGPLPGTSSNPNTNPGLYNLPYLTLPNNASSALTIRAPPRRKNRRRRRRKPRGGGGGEAKTENGEDDDGADSQGPDETDSETETSQNPPVVADFQLDKYADVFVPEYLQAIQRQPQRFRLLEPVPLFPSPSYLPDSILDPADVGRAETILSIAPDPEQRCPLLSADSYYKHFLHVLQDELSTVVAHKAQIILWKASISLADTIGPNPTLSPHERQLRNNVTSPDAQFVISVPGIRENHPRLDIGDTVHMREVLVDRKEGSGLAFEARVTVLRKREGLVHLHCPPLQAHVRTYWGLITPRDIIPMTFNISFLANARPFVAMDTATFMLDRMLTDPHSSQHNDNPGRTLAHRWLFPEPLDLLIDAPTLLPLPTKENVVWVDSGLNHEQKTAAASISQYHHPIPYLISGPPGTGKTRTVVESVYQILCVVPNSHILLCAPSNSATDTLALRLAQGGYLKPHELLRLNDKDRTFAEVPDTIRAFCYVEDDKFALPPFKTLMAYRVVVTTCLDAQILVAAQCTNSLLGKLEERVVNWIHPTRGKHLTTEPHWTHLLIDEAAQASEPEVLIPISVVTTSPSVQSDRAASEVQASQPFVPQLVLCGDPNQLGPIVASHSARNDELDVSLLERLFERPVYAEHPLARSKFSWVAHRQVPVNFLSSPASIRKNPSWIPFVNLAKNYRSHAAILMPPSAIFYNDSLEPCASNGRINWSGLPNPELPLVFIGNEGPEECVDERATWFNPSEISRVVETIKSLMFERERCSPPLQVSEIGVIAPWREQVWRLREKLRQEQLAAVDVGSVEVVPVVFFCLDDSAQR